MKEKQDININAPNGTIIIVSGEDSEVARQIENLANQNKILVEQLKVKDDLIESLDRKLKELESK